LALAAGSAGVALAADLLGGDWRPSFLAETDLPAGIQMTVHFGPDGKITGSGGCNQFFGAYAISGNTINIGPIASTRKGCPGIIGGEAAFFAPLEIAKSFTQEGGTLVLFDATGAKIAEFDRVG
jgi:heat shock protein HslJ